MSSLSISFAGQIIEHAKARGTDLTREEIDSLSATINSVARVDDHNQVAFDLGRGLVATLDDAITMLSVGMGRPAVIPTTNISIPKDASPTARAILTNQAAKAGSDALKQKQATDLVATFGNPWRTGNATHRAYVMNTHPQLASRLRREAGERV